MGILDNVNFSGGWLGRAFDFPQSQGWLGEQSPSNGSWVRPDSPLGRIIGMTPETNVQQTATIPAAPPEATPAPGWNPQQMTMGTGQPMAPQMPQARPINRAGLDEYVYNQSPMGDASMPPNARPSVYNAPAPAIQQAALATPNLGDNFMAGINNLNSGGNPITMLANVVGGFATGQRMDAQGKREANQKAVSQAVAQSLISRGYSPQEAMGMAQAAAIDPKVAEKILGDAYARPKTPEEYFARKMDTTSRTGASGGDGTNHYFDYVRGKSGAEKSGQVEGERQANASIDLPSVIAQGKEALRLVSELRTHPGRGNPIFFHSGTSNYLPDNLIPGGTDAYGANALLKQLKGGAFLEAFKSLKGGGQITEIEGRKATEAITRMDRAQSRAEFDRALSDYEGIIKLGIDRANQQANKPAPYGFKGNSEWQTVRPGVRIKQVQ